MKYLVYMSTSVRLFNDLDLKQILRKSQANNTVNDLTGMLLYSEGSFVQVLEGHADDLEATYLKIMKDSRHKNIIKLAEGNLSERLFPTWSMGFKTVPQLELSKFDAYVDPKKTIIWDDKHVHPAITIMKTFADTNHF